MQFGLQHMMQTQGPGSMMRPTIDTGMGMQTLAQKQVGAGGGAMDGIMNSIQTGFDQLDGAMQGAFNTIQDSLSNNYSSQEVIVPTNPGVEQPPHFDVMPRLPMPPDFGGGIQPLPQPGPDFPGADFGNLMPYEGNNFQKMPIENMISNFGPQYNMLDPGFSSPGFLGTMDPTPTGGIGNASLNQDNNQQQSIDEMFASLAGQFNG
jgi:hypothetical protein